jgi:hypothetical protein
MERTNPRHDVRTKRVFKTTDQALEAITAELVKLNFRTTRTFWVGDQKYTARKTNELAGYVNLNIRPPLKKYNGRASEGSIMRKH